MLQSSFTAMKCILEGDFKPIQTPKSALCLFLIVNEWVNRHKQKPCKYQYGFQKEEKTKILSSPNISRIGKSIERLTLKKKKKTKKTTLTQNYDLSRFPVLRANVIPCAHLSPSGIRPSHLRGAFPHPHRCITGIIWSHVLTIIHNIITRLMSIAD